MLSVAAVCHPQQFGVVTQDGLFGLSTEDLDVSIVTPSGGRLPIRITPVSSDGTSFLIDYLPTEPGDHLVMISLAGKELNCGRPYRVRCCCTDSPGPAGQVRAHGPGLWRGTTGRPAEFCIDTRRAGPGGLSVTIEGPSEAVIQCRDNGDATCTVTYLPVVSGAYYIHIGFNGVAINGSPFVARFGAGWDDVSQIRCWGAGIRRDHGRIPKLTKTLSLSQASSEHHSIRTYTHSPGIGILEENYYYYTLNQSTPCVSLIKCYASYSFSSFF